MFQCNEHVEMNKFLCSLACTWMTIIDGKFYIIDSLSLDVLLLGGCLVVRWNNLSWKYKFKDSVVEAEV